MKLNYFFIRTQEAETYLKIRQVKTKLVSQFLFSMCLFLPQTPVRHDSLVTNRKHKARPLPEGKIFNLKKNK